MFRTQRYNNKNLMTSPMGNSEFWFPRPSLRSRGNKTHCFPREQSSSVLLYLPTPNYKKNCEEIVCFTPAGSQMCRGFKEHGLITCESKVHVVVSPGS